MCLELKITLENVLKNEIVCVSEKTVQISKIILEKVMNELCIKRNQKGRPSVSICVDLF